MPASFSRRVGRRAYNGFEVDLYGFLPSHLIHKDQQSAAPGFFDFWDPGNSRLEKIGGPGSKNYAAIVQDRPRRGTVAVFSGPQALADDGQGNILDGGGDNRGTVDYRTGRVQVEFENTTVYDVYVGYATGPEVDTASHFDEFSKIWDRLADQPVLQRTFWAIELDAVSLVNRIDDYKNLSYVDTISAENAPYAFEGWGFDQVSDLDTELSRVWLRSMSTQWKLKASLRMWHRILQNIGIDINIFSLFKSHPLNNYGKNPGEIYSRVYTEISLEEQAAYEAALKAAGFDPQIVPKPVSGGSVTHTIGIGAGSFRMPIQVPVLVNPPDWATASFQLVDTFSGLPDPESYTFNPLTGSITGSSGASGVIDLMTGTGNIDFGRVLSTSYRFSVSYSVLGTPYQAARVDIEVEIDESKGFKSGDRVAEIILRVLESMRPIHVLIRLLNLGIIEEELAIVSDGSCCGPNQAETVEYSWPVQNSVEFAGGAPAGETVYGGSLGSSPVVPGTFRVADVGTSQVLVDNGSGGLSGNGIGVISYNSGLWWAQFDAPTSAVPLVTYDRYRVLEPATSKSVRYMADGFDMGDAKTDRSHAEFAVTYDDPDIDSDYLALSPDLVSGNQYSGSLASDLIPGSVVIQDYATGQVIQDDGSGNLTGDVDAGGTNTVDYVSGGYDVTFSNPPVDPVAVFEFSSASAQLPDQEDIFTFFHDNAILEGDYIRISVEDDLVIDPVGSAGSVIYTGVLSEKPIPGGTTFKESPGPGQVLEDLVLISPLSGNGSGSIDYNSGDLSVNFSQVTTTTPVAKYKYVDSSGFILEDEVILGAPGGTAYAVTLAGGQIVPGSVIVESESQSLVDSGTVSLSGNGGGFLNYITGEYSLEFLAVTVDNVIAEYETRDSLVF
jgi:hypothetical protein